MSNLCTVLSFISGIWILGKIYKKINLSLSDLLTFINLFPKSVTMTTKKANIFSWANVTIAFHVPHVCMWMYFCTANHSNMFENEFTFPQWTEVCWCPIFSVFSAVWFGLGISLERGKCLNSNEKLYCFASEMVWFILMYIHDEIHL